MPQNYLILLIHYCIQYLLIFTVFLNWYYSCARTWWTSACYMYYCIQCCPISAGNRRFGLTHHPCLAVQTEWSLPVTWFLWSRAWVRHLRMEILSEPKGWNNTPHLSLKCNLPAPIATKIATLSSRPYTLIPVPATPSALLGDNTL